MHTLLAHAGYEAMEATISCISCRCCGLLTQTGDPYFECNVTAEAVSADPSHQNHRHFTDPKTIAKSCLGKNSQRKNMIGSKCAYGWGKCRELMDTAGVRAETQLDHLQRNLLHPLHRAKDDRECDIVFHNITYHAGKCNTPHLTHPYSYPSTHCNTWNTRRTTHATHTTHNTQQRWCQWQARQQALVPLISHCASAHTHFPVNAHVHTRAHMHSHKHIKLTHNSGGTSGRGDLRR